MTFPELTHVGMITLACTKTNQLNMPKLKTVDGDCSLGIGGFDPEKVGSLESVGGTLSLSLTAEKLQLPATLKSLSKLNVSAGITELDLRGVGIDVISFNGTGLENTTIIGDDVFKGDFNLQNLNGHFPKLKGFREVGSLTIGYLGLSNDDVEIATIRKVNGNFSYHANSNVTGITLTDLEEIVGDFDLFSNIKWYHFPKLKTIGGNALVSIQSYDENSFPALTTVKGDFRFDSGYFNWGQDYSPEMIEYPSLEEVGGVLEISPLVGEASYENTKWTSLDFFGKLRKVGGLRITNHKSLVSYEALKTAILSCPEGKWDVVGNKYNPTYKQLVEENQWTMPE